MKYVEKIPDRLECQLMTINQLAKVLTNNTAHKGCSEPAQIDLLGEDAIFSAITFLSELAHNDLCHFLNALESPR